MVTDIATAQHGYRQRHCMVTDNVTAWLPTTSLLGTDIDYSLVPDIDYSLVPDTESSLVPTPNHLWYLHRIISGTDTESSLVHCRDSSLVHCRAYIPGTLP